MEKPTPTKAKSGTLIRKCSCTHAFQDKLYGATMRVFNRSQKSAHASCTVCSARASVE